MISSQLIFPDKASLTLLPTDEAIREAIAQEKKKPKDSRTYDSLRLIVESFLPFKFPAENPKLAYEALRKISKHTNDKFLLSHMRRCLRVSLPLLSGDLPSYKFHCTDDSYYSFDRVLFRLYFLTYAKSRDDFERRASYSETQPKLWDRHILELLDQFLHKTQELTSFFSYKDSPEAGETILQQGMKMSREDALELLRLIDEFGFEHVEETFSLPEYLFSLCMHVWKDEDTLHFCAAAAFGDHIEMDEEILKAFKADLRRSVSYQQVRCCRPLKMGVKSCFRSVRSVHTNTSGYKSDHIQKTRWQKNKHRFPHSALLRKAICREVGLEMKDRIIHQQLVPWINLPKRLFKEIIEGAFISPRTFEQNIGKISIEGATLRALSALKQIRFRIQSVDDLECLSRLSEDPTYHDSIIDVLVEKLPEDIPAQNRLLIYLGVLRFANKRGKEEESKRVIKILQDDTTFPRPYLRMLAFACLSFSSDSGKFFPSPEVATKIRDDIDNELKGEVKTIFEEIRSASWGEIAGNFSVDDVSLLVQDDSMIGSLCKAMSKSRWLTIELTKDQECEQILFQLPLKPFLANSIGCIKVKFPIEKYNLSQFETAVTHFGPISVVDQEGKDRARDSCLIA